MSSTQSFLSLALNKKKLRCERFLDEMDQVIPWYKLINKVEQYYKEKKTGRNRKETKLMLKIYFLQQWYNLSDPAAEVGLDDSEFANVGDDIWKKFRSAINVSLRKERASIKKNVWRQKMQKGICT